MTSNEDYLDSLLANINNQLDENSEALFEGMSAKDDEELMNILGEDLIPTEEEFEEKSASESAAPEDNSETSTEEAVSEKVENSVDETTENSFDEEAKETVSDSEESVPEEEAMPEEDDISEEVSSENEEETEEIPTEEFIDMDDIDAILSDVSDIHPERTKSSKELEEQIAKYEENPEAAEEALLTGEDDNEDEGAAEEVTAEEESNADDILSSLGDVEALLADVEKQAQEEEEKLAQERSTETDGDIAEINDILNKSDNNEAVNDDLLSMIEGLDSEEEESEEGLFENEDQTEEKDKKEKKKKDKKKKNKKEGDDNSSEGEEAGNNKEKKPGLFSKLLGFMFDSDDEGEEEEENKEGKEGKKGKKDKKGKGKNGAKADDNAAIEAELDAEDAKSKKGKKDKKEKKPKKEKAPKKDKKAKAEEPEEKQKSSIKMKGIILTFAFCATLLGLILFAAILGPKVLARNEARIAYYNHDYETASNKLYGMKLSESDRLIYEKASVLYKLELFYDKVEAYETTGDRTKMLDALFETWEECREVSVDARLLSITEEVDEFRKMTEEKIMTEYGISPEEIAEIVEMKPAHYTIAVKKIAAGENYKETSNDEISEENAEEHEKLEDMLPEEMELIDSLETEQ